MSAPVTHSTSTAHGPPVPPTKPVISSPGAYMAQYTSSATIPTTGNTAGIHSVNKTHEKPAIAARPIPPPTLPKYSSSFSKLDRERNEFIIGGNKIDKDKDGGIGGSYRLASLDRLATRQRILEQNGGYGLSINSTDRNGSTTENNSNINNNTSNNTNNNINNNNNNNNNNINNNINNTNSNGSSIIHSLQSKREMFFKSDSQHSPSGPPPNPPSSLNNNHVVNSNTNSTQNTPNSTPTSNEKHIITNNNHIHSNSSSSSSITAASATTTTTTTPTTVTSTVINNLTNNVNNLIMKEKQHIESNSNHHQDSNKLLTERHDREKLQHQLNNNHHTPLQQQQLQQLQQQQQQQQQLTRPKPKELDGYVGFANLPNQVYRKAVKKGFEFTLMVVGESGLGKSTLINSMFLSDIYNQDQHPGPSHRIKKTVAVETTKVLLKENGVNLTLTVVDTPGFGDAVDNSNCWVPIIDFVESKYEEYLTAESRVHRKALSDNRVHTCLYFIAPSGHGLKPLDVEFMQRLCDKVNIIPIIAKADTMTPEEVQLFKKQILNEIAQHKIKIYDFPEPLDDEEEVKNLRQLRSRVPFAIVGASAVIEIDGRKIRGRKYPWGIAEVENLEHCDFIALRNMVIRTHLQDLKDVTNNVHYENYRCRKLAGLGADGKQARLSNKNPLAQMEEEKRDHDIKMKKMEAEMEQVFEMKVKEKRQKLKDSEVELTRRHEERKKALEMQIRELEDRKRSFEQEKNEWEHMNNITLDELRRRSLEANSRETSSLTSRSSDESKSRRVFGSLLRRHTSFGAPDIKGGSTNNIVPATSPQENNE